MNKFNFTQDVVGLHHTDSHFAVFLNIITHNHFTGNFYILYFPLVVCTEKGYVCKTFLVTQMTIN